MKISHGHKFLMLSAMFLAITARGEETTQAPKLRDLSWSEASSLFQKLGAKVNDTRTSVGLVGFMYRECLPHVIFSSRQSDGGTEDFRIQASDQLTSCINQQKLAHPGAALGDESVFSRLSMVGGTSIGVQDRDVSIGFTWEDKSEDPAVWRRASVGSDLKFESVATRDAREARERQLAEEKRLERLMNIAKTCRGSEENNLRALSAIRQLVDSGKLDDVEADDLRKSISDSQLAVLKKKVASLKGSDLEAVDEDIRFWLERNKSSPKAAEKAAELRLELARRLAETNPLSVSSNERSLEILTELGESGELSDAMRRRAQLGAFEMRGNLTAAKLSAFAREQVAKGVPAPVLQQMLMQNPDFVSFHRDMQKDLASACNKSDRASFERCTQLRQIAVSQPTRILEVANQQAAQAQMQIMQQMQHQAPTQQSQQFFAPGGLLYGTGGAIPVAGR